MLHVLYNNYIISFGLGDGKNETILGNRAANIGHSEPTMWLDLSKVTGNKEKKHVVIHEFGHALGLDHEHKRSDLWKEIGDFIDVEKMKAEHGESFAINWGCDQKSENADATEYDPNSIMHYR